VYGKLIFSADPDTATAFAAGFGGNALAAWVINTLVTYHDAIRSTVKGVAAAIENNFRTAGWAFQKSSLRGDVTSSGSGCPARSASRRDSCSSQT